MEVRSVPITREGIPLILNEMRLFGCGVEIGVQEGIYSEIILSAWRGRNLISVDAWAEQPKEVYRDSANVGDDEHEKRYQNTRRRMKKYGKRSTIWRMLSESAAYIIPDAALDFCYIDARHDYEGVTKDLKAWYPKVKPNGLFAGHDFVDRPDIHFGVEPAVLDFFAKGDPFTKKKVTITLTTETTTFPSWLMVVPEP